MKARFFAWTVLALTLAACDKNNDENLNDGPVAAKFTAAISEAVPTRASGTDWAEGDCIGITGADYTNVPYKRVNGQFVPDDTTIYYQTPDPVTFSAYYPYNAAGGILTATTDATAQQDQPAIDFLYATGATGSTHSPQVYFTDNSDTGGPDCSFHHCMSQITINFDKGSGVDFTTNKPTDYTLSDIELTGTFDTGTGIAASDGQTSAGVLTMMLTDGATTSSVILFPQSVENIPLDVTFNDQLYHATLTVPDGVLMAGKNYVYKVLINNQDMSVESAEISQWNGVACDDAHAEM